MYDCAELEAVRVLYGQAEEALKSYERITLTNLAPAINQLRYAGHHLLAATKGDDVSCRDRHIMSARRHCERALFDAREATIVFLLDDFRSFRENLFTEAELSSALPDWQSILLKMSTGCRLLEQAGMAKFFTADGLAVITDLLDVRDKIHAAMPKLASMREKRELEKVKALQAAEDELRKEQEARELAKEKKSDRIAVLGILLSVASILLAIIALGPIRRFIFHVTGINLD